MLPRDEGVLLGMVDQGGRLTYSTPLISTLTGRVPGLPALTTSTTAAAIETAVPQDEQVNSIWR